VAVIRNIRNRHAGAQYKRPAGRVAGGPSERTAPAPPSVPAVVEAPPATAPPLRLVGEPVSPWEPQPEPDQTPAAEARPKPRAFEPIDESTGGLDPHLRESRAVRVVSRLLQAVCLVYAAALLYWIWMAKDLSVSLVVRDPLFGTYSVLVTMYVLARFFLAPFYRSTPDTGHRPSASIVIPAFNEEDCIGQTIDACYGAEYPEGLVEVVAVDDGSSDGTWKAMLAARRRHPSLVCVQFSHNRGKRAAMAEGIRRSTGEVCVFIDSDSVIEQDGLCNIMADFRDQKVGAVVGTADVMNKGDNLMTKMQQVRYYVAFRVVKGSESVFGAVTCASGCFSAYRRSALLGILDRWENQTFLGRKATYGDDRALTNMILRNHRVMFQSEARSHTIAPTDIRTFLVQQLRWKKSWLRESLYVVRFIWRKHPIAAAMTYMSVLFPWVAPIVVFHALYWRSLGGGDPWFYIVGAYVMALLYSLYYAISRRSPIWYHGITFIVIYMVVLVWQTYYAVATLRNTKWGTRASSHTEGVGDVIVAGPGDGNTEVAA
jgi:hyaluronan synthase